MITSARETVEIDTFAADLNEQLKPEQGGRDWEGLDTSLTFPLDGRVQDVEEAYEAASDEYYFVRGMRNMMTTLPLELIQPGHPATICMWTDRDPATVVEVLRFKSGDRKGQVRGVVVTMDHWKVVSGSESDGSAEYEYTSRPEGDRLTFLMTKKGLVRQGSRDRLSLGSRRRYFDPSF
jgi:hypothetical protein